ncbi:MAG: hypothetical protein EXS63_07565, partial [Candidatus Omnitrophica bacterium]|nr:hypothetical protein [Candidatus Omnitrophota bacterium]
MFFSRVIGAKEDDFMVSKTTTRIPRLAWIGVRGYGARFWKSIQKSPWLCVQACFHPELLVAKEAADRMRCTYYTSLKETLDDSEVDAVILIIPNQFHFEYAKAAL